MTKDNFDDYSLAQRERENDLADAVLALQRECGVERSKSGDIPLYEQVEALSQYMDEAQKRILSLEAKVRWQDRVIAEIISKLINAQPVRSAMELEQWDILYRSKPD